MYSMNLVPRPNYSVKTRVLNALAEFPATVRELEDAGCGSASSIRRVLRSLRASGDLVYLAARAGNLGHKRGVTRYALRRGNNYQVIA